MPVLVTGVEEALGATIARTLLAGGGEVRVWLDAERCGDDDARAWRARGAKAGLGELTDEGRLEAGLEQVHTVVHAAGGPLTDAGRGTEHLATVVSALLGAGSRRLIWVTDLASRSSTGAADPDGGGPYVAALRERAALVEVLPIDVVVVRTGLRWGAHDGLTAWLAARGDDLGVSAAHAPVWIPDVAATVAAADAQRGSGAAVRMDVELVGPDTLTAEQLAARLADAARVSRAVATRPPHVDDGVLRAWLRVPAVGSDAALGRQGTDVAGGLRALVTVGGQRRG